MRWYGIVTGIFLILSIIDFALAAPVLAQDKRQARVDMVRILPNDVITVLWKRWDEELEKLREEFFKTLGKPVESSGRPNSRVKSMTPRSDIRVQLLRWFIQPQHKRATND